MTMRARASGLQATAAAVTTYHPRARCPPTMTRLLLLCVLLLAFVPCDAQDTAAATEVAIAAEATTSPTSASAETKVTKEALASWYERQFKENETQLVGFPSEELQSFMPSGERPCRDLPSVQTRSTTFPTNNGCPAFFDATGASCTCLTGYVIHPEEWEFKVKKKTAMKKLPLNLRSNDTFEIDAISTLWVNKTLTKLYVIRCRCVLKRGEAKLRSLKMLMLLQENRRHVGRTAAHPVHLGQPR